MNCYDFDNTIYRKDSSIKFYLYCLFRKPKMIFHFIYLCFIGILNKIGIISTKSFKEKFFSFLKNMDNLDECVQKFWDKEYKNINNWYLENKKDNDVICSASPQFLVEPIMRRINPLARVVCTNMDKNTGAINGENLKGKQKVIALRKVLQSDELKFDAVYTDSMSDFPILDLTDNKYIVCGKKVYEFGQQKPTFFTKLKYIIKQLRVKHYVKNGLIFLPLFFSGLLSQSNNILLCILGFISFSLMASVVYVLNDLVDAKNDRKHSTKRKRPIACYMIKKYEAIIMLIILFLSSILISYFSFGTNILVFTILIGYAILNILYSFVLKNIPIIDVFVLASCYLLRIFYGGLIVGVYVSKWLYLTVLCGSLFMGFGKRRNEIKKQSSTTRKVNKYYNYDFLDKNLYICLAMCLVFYSLWAIDFEQAEYIRFNRLLLLATIPIVYFIMMRYSLDIEQSTNSGDPIDVLFKDYILILSGIILVTTVVIAIYVPVNLNI